MTTRNTRTTWRDEYYVDIYLMAREGLTNEEIAKKLGVSHSSVAQDWQKQHPALTYALKRGRTDGTRDRKGDGKKMGDLVDYVYAQLPAHLKILWDKLEWHHEMAAGPEKIEALLRPESMRVRQSLWVHAMLVCDFNQSDACRMVNISKRTLDKWMAEDADFPAMVDELHFHKKNFFEALLVKYSKLGESKLVAMANQTLNRDRGYGKMLEVQVNGTVNHNHLNIPFEKLDLPVDVLLQVEEALARYNATLTAGKGAPIPVQALAVRDSPAKTQPSQEDDGEEEE